jgi:hypothetical protein
VTTQLVYSRLVFAPVAVLLTVLTLHRNVLHQASIAISLVGLALHQHALCRFSLARLGFHAELLV